MSKIKPVAWLLTDDKVNNIQINTIQTLIDRAKHAHYCNVYLRINGNDEHYQADWLKHLVMSADALREIERMTIERCAKVCQEVAGDLMQVDCGDDGAEINRAYGAEDCADAIRALPSELE